MIKLSSVCVVLGAASLAGCATTDMGAPAPMTPLSRYSLQVETGLDRIALAVRDDGLSANQVEALRDLADRYRVGGVGWVNVEAPSGDDPVSARHAYAVRGALEASGVPGERIKVFSYSAPDPRAPVLAGFETVQAAIPNCSLANRDLGPRYSNQSSQSLGCAITANMAAQISDPRDILGAKAMTPADSGRAAVIFSNYRQGRITSAGQEPLVDGKISQAVD